MCFMTHTFFFALFFLVVQINSSHFLSRCLSHFFSLGRRRRRRRRRRKEEEEEGKTGAPLLHESARHRCGGRFETKKRVVLVFFFFFEEREEAKSSSIFIRGRLFERIPIQMADDAPTPTQQKPTTTHGGGETAGPSQTPNTAQQNQNSLLPVVAQKTGWTGPCTRPASCPFYNSFTSTPAR